MFFSTLVAFVALASSAQAVIYTTSPVASTSWVAGQEQTISWQDDNTSPNLEAFGPAKVTLGVGNAITQTQLQLIVDNVDVSTTKSIVFTPDPSVGENGDGAVYFIRFESLSLKDATQPQFPALGFSAKFALTGMTGTFNTTVKQQILGASTAPLGPTSASASSTASNTASRSASSTASRSSGAPTSSASAQGAANGALSTAATSFVAVAGSVIALAVAMIL
ncbi:unnamed protein product [Somion occarium]|uniref:Yeast cell wall synthesis Kre9/Knh1-like N-terminal domain-containing protein n=1 Tax=Somion occarium TaxID=3059160 RepID=A0ABP1DPB9_9APHY